MKKNIMKSMVVLLVLISTPNYAMAGKDKDPLVKEEVSEKTHMLIQRVEEIKEMDKKSMTKDEKKTMKNELQSINKELKQQGNGTYISLGGVIIIVLLLIILL